MMQKILQQLKGSFGRGHRSAPALPETKSQPRLSQEIAIAGAKQVLVPAGFYKAYGLDPRMVAATAVVAPSAMTEEARFALAEVYREGGTRGPDTAALAVGSRQLSANERLYFILMSYRPSKHQALLALVALEAAGSSRAVG